MPIPRILVAEDDPAFRRVIRYTLEREGWEVEAVSDGELAFQALAEKSFDCLVTDHEMPRMSGSELIERIRSQSCSPPLMGIILCTARGLEIDAALFTERYQVAAVLHKPFSPRGLVTVINERVFQDQMQEPVV